MKFVVGLFLLLAVLAGFGFYRGWLSLSTQNAVDRGRKVDVNLSVDGDKLESDTKAVKEKIRELDGRPVQLATLLMKKYGWSSADAQHKVDLFMTRISINSQ